MDSYKKGGQAGNSNLLATNRLFKKNPLFKKKKKKASGIYNPKAAFKYEEGGALLTKKVTCKNCGWKWDAADGGDDVTTCHKCGGLGLVHAKKGGDISIPTLNTMDKGGEPKTTKKEGDPKLTTEQQEYLKNKYREAAEIKKQAKAGNPLSAQMAKEFKAKYNESWTCPSDKCPVVENQYPTGYDQPIVTPVPPGKTQVGTQEIQNLDPKTGRVKTVIEPVYEDNPMPEKLPLLPPQLIDIPRAELQGEYQEEAELVPPNWGQHDPWTYRLPTKLKYRGKLQNPSRYNPAAAMTQYFSGYEPLNEEEYVDVEGRIVPKGFTSLQDIGVQRRYNKAYDEYEAKQQEYEAKQQFAKAMATSYGLKKAGGSTKNYIEVDIPEEQIQNYIDQGYIIEHVSKPKMEEGGTPSQLWYQYTGTPWSEAKAKGLTDGSAEQNLALAQRLQSGEFGEPNLNIQQYENRRSSYDDAVINMVRQGQTLDQLVESRVGTREGLLQRFPDLFSGSSVPTRTQVVPTAKAKTKTPEQIAIEQKVGRDWLTGKAKELGNEVMESASNSFWGKTAKKVGQATYNYMIEQQTKDREAKKKQEQVKLKKVEKEVQKEIKKINPKVVKTPSVLELLQEVGLNYQQSPLKKFTDTKAEPDFATNLMAQVQQNQKRFNPVQTSKPQQPIANGMGSNFAQGQNPMQIEARNKAMGVTPQNLPEAPSPSIGWKKWEDTDLGYASGEIAKMVPTSAEEFIETTPGKWLGKKVYDSGLLPKEKEDQLKRKLEKLGEIPIKEESVKIDPNKKIKEINVKKNAPVTEFTEEIGSSGDGKYLSYRNQWDNKKGFEYITTRDNSDRPDDESYDNVIGVGHYLLDAYVYGDKSYSHKNNQSFLRKAKENNDWIPAFKKTNSNRVLLTYKKPSELTDKDVVVSPLRQYKFSSINFNNPISSSSLGYKANAGIKHLTTKEGDDFKVTFSNPDVYGRHSGASVVFIFKDKFDNTIVRDFAGSLNQIKEEGKSIIKDYELKSTDLTIGYHDVASYGAKPKADSSGKLKGNTWKNWNNEPHTGGALLIPKSK